MIDSKSWIAQNCTPRSYDDPDIDPDLVASRHRKAVAAAKSVLRDNLKQQLHQKLDIFHTEDRADRKKLSS